METFIQTTQAIGLTPLNIALLAILYLMGAKLGVFPKPRWMNGTTPQQQSESEFHELAARMDRLQQHFNDETTRELQEIKRGHEELNQGQRDLKEKVTETNNQLRDANNTLSNIEKYGITDWIDKYYLRLNWISGLEYFLFVVAVFLMVTGF